MHEVFLGQSSRKFHVPGRGPDQLNRCKMRLADTLDWKGVKPKILPNVILRFPQGPPFS